MQILEGCGHGHGSKSYGINYGNYAKDFRDRDVEESDHLFHIRHMIGTIAKPLYTNG